MFRPGVNTRCGTRLGTGIVTHNNSTEVCNVQIRGSEGAQWQHRPLTLERSATEVSIRVKDSHGLVSGSLRKQSTAVLATMASLCPDDIKQSTSNMTDSRSGNSEDVESSAESGGSVESSTMSDGDSANVHESQLLLRSTSGASMVTSGAGSKEREIEELVVADPSTEENEGENEVDEDVNELESLDSDSDSEMHSMQREHESAATTWTDDKHSSFLNSMEQTFVRSLYNQGLGGMGVFGNPGPFDDSEQDCVESRPVEVDAYGCCTSHPGELFKLLQGGSYQQNAYYRPHGLEAAPAPALFANPWVQHFKQKVYTTANISSLPPASLAEAVSTSAKEVSTAMALVQSNMSDGQTKDNLEGATKEKSIQVEDVSGGSEESERKEMDSGAEVPELDQGLRLWQNRLQSGGQLSTITTNRKDIPSWMLKRPSSIDAENAAVFLAKRNKSTQQELARKDLEILEQFLAKERLMAEGIQAVGGPNPEQSEQTPVVQVQKVFVPPVEEANPLLAPVDKHLWRLVGRSAMDQVVPLLGRTVSYESKGSLSAFHHPMVGSACTKSQPQTESCGLNSSSVPDLNTPLCLSIGSACTSSEPTFTFIKDGESAVAAWSPRHSVGNGGEKDAHELAGFAFRPFVHPEEEDPLDRCSDGHHNRSSSLGKHSRGFEGDDDTRALAIQTHGLDAGEADECELLPQLSPISLSKAKTWTWGLRGLRRRVDEASKNRKQFHDHKVEVGSSSRIEV